MKKTITSALLGALLFCAFLISGCKKELYNAEKIDHQRLKEIQAYKKDVQVSTISLNQFKNKANLKALGSLKTILLNEKNENGIKTNSSLGVANFNVNTDSIKVLQVNGTTNYVFAIVPKNSRAVTFRNITVQENATGTTAQMTVYTPTKNWIRNWRAGKKTTFEGKIDVIPVNLNDLGVLPLPQIQSAKSQEKISSLKAPNRTSEDQFTYQCTTTNVWTEVPYQCGGYDKHWPWEYCPFVGDQRAGYRWETKEVTNCSWIKVEPEPGGGPGNTTPNPGDYNPCDENLPEGYTPPATTIDETPCDEIKAPTEQEIKDKLTNKPFALFGDIDCDIIKKWIAIAKFKPDQAVIDDLYQLTVSATNRDFYIKKIAYIQKLDDANSTVVNMDYFSVTVNQLPIVNGQRLGPGQFLNYIRTNMNNFTNGGKVFVPYNYYGINDAAKWNSNDPKGAILSLDLSGPDNGSVITSYSSTDKWTFTTIHEPENGDHPVSGNRDFGYIANSNGTYTFYTRGVDRLTSWDVSLAQTVPDYFIEGKGIPFSKADALWASFQNGIVGFVNTHAGNASVNAVETKRPNWDTVKDVIDGKKPLSTLSKDCVD